MAKKRFAAFVILCIALISIGGCGKKKEELRVAHIYQPLAGPNHKQNFEWLESVVKRFKREHPGLPVRLEMIQWDKIDAKSVSDYRAGVSHDVLMSSPQFMPQHSMLRFHHTVC